jgi:hypothetical protein
MTFVLHRRLTAFAGRHNLRRPEGVLMKTTSTALVCFGAAAVIVGCAHLGSDGGKLTGVHQLTLTHKGYPENPQQNEHDFRQITWRLKKGNGPGFGIHVRSNDWVEWHNPNEPNFAIAVRQTNYWKPPEGVSWLSIPNLGTWPAVATTNGYVRLQFTPDSDTKPGHFNYRIAIPPPSEIYAMVAPQSNYCNVDIVEETIIWGGAFTNPISGASERIPAGIRAESKGERRVIAGIPTDHNFTFSHKWVPPAAQAKAHRGRVLNWQMNDRTADGFDATVKESKPVISWAYGADGATNFAILVPSTNHWLPVAPCSWTTIPCLGPWPAVRPTQEGYIFLQFLPVNSKPGDSFHYKIAHLGDPVGKVQGLSDSETFPDNSDDDIVDTTIVWGGGKPGDPASAPPKQ